MLVESRNKASEKICNGWWDLEWKRKAEVAVGRTGAKCSRSLFLSSSFT